MNKYVSLDKRSKKAQREYHAKQRRTWGELNPVTRSVPSGKTYNRKKEKQRIGKEFRNGFEADLFLQYYDKIGLLIDEYAKRAKERWGNTPEYKELLRIEYI